ncbi:hypothetical protein ABZZ20_32405 [Streptomyces sp. NPDC006430]|uniref:hypothetical protein n=1 Tax=Streptomyces sp. NPDC006430 TaxID=3154299 RepID=UPI0033A0E411
MSTPPPYGSVHPFGGQQSPPPQTYGPPAPSAGPQQGWGGTQQGWGAPPSAPGPYGYGHPVPPRRDRSGLVAGIVIGSLVVLGGLGFSLKAVLGGASGSSFPPAEHMLTVPPKLLDGQYTLTADGSQDMKEEMASEPIRRDPSIRNPRFAVGQYAGPASKGGGLSLSGMYGQFKDPESVRDSILRGARTSEGATEAGPPKVIKPAGSDVAVSCQVLVLVLTEEGAKSTIPVCAWGDGNTAAFVGWVAPDGADQEPGSVDLDKIARLTLDVRKETRRPLG